MDINAENLRKIREDKGMSQKEFALVLGISFRSLQDYEGGKRIPEAKKLLITSKLSAENVPSEKIQEPVKPKPREDPREESRKGQEKRIEDLIADQIEARFAPRFDRYDDAIEVIAGALAQNTLVIDELIDVLNKQGKKIKKENE